MTQAKSNPDNFPDQHSWEQTDFNSSTPPVQTALVMSVAPEPDGCTRLARLAADALNCPVGLIVRLDPAFAWVHAKAVREAGEVSIPERIARRETMCDHVAAVDQTLVIPDTRRHSTARMQALHAPNSPYVFYAGTPLRRTDGSCWGALVVLDRRPRRFSAHQVALLEEFGALAAREAACDDLSASNNALELSDADLPQEYFHDFPLSMWVYDIKTLKFLEVNQCALDQYGYSRAEFAGMTVRDIHPAEQLSMLDARLEITATRFDPTRFHNSHSWQHRTKDGRVLDVEVQSRDLMLRGRRARLVAVIDVTKRRNISRAWQMVHSAVANATDAIGVRDFVRGWFYANDALQMLVGYTEDELNASGSVLHLLCRPEALPAIYAQLETGMAWAGELPIRTKSEHETIVFARVNPVRDDQGKIIGRSLIFTDITEQKRIERDLFVSRQRYKSLFDYYPDGVLRLNREGTIQAVNGAITDVYGYEPYDLIGFSYLTLVAPEDLEPAMRVCEQAGDGAPKTWELRLRHRDGRILVTSGISIPAVVDGEVVGAYSVLRDITEQRRSVECLRASEERFRQLTEYASDMIAIADPEGIIRYESPSVERVLGYAPNELIGTKAYDLLHPDDATPVRTQIQGLRMRPGATIAFEARLRHRWDAWRHVECVVTNLVDAPGVTGYVVNCRDITERRQSEELLGFLAHHDPLTDLPNRLFFTDRLQNALTEAHDENLLVAVLFLDLDRFKVINDTLGHSVGDLLLRAVAERLRMLTLPGDTVARWGGDEFTLILPKLRAVSDAEDVAQRIIASLSETFEIQGHELYVTATVGISAYRPGCEDDGETLVRNADTAMYRAKDRGKNSYQVYAPMMNTGAMARLSLETALRRAVERDELILYYQPQVDSETGSVSGVEALLRWQHPTLGLIAPSEFIPLAEETGLIVPVGDWALRQACAQARRWHDAGFPMLRVAVNISAHQFRRRDFVVTVASALSAAGVSASCLELELTESALMENEEQNVKALTELNAMGVLLAIDDFGTGYSSFAYLKRYPIRALKIDQSFVRGIGVHPDDEAITQGMVAMASNLRLRVVAEGVETTEQHAFLRRHGCSEMQGYYFSRPVPAEEILPLLSGA